MEKMKKLLPAVAALLLFHAGAQAQDMQQVRKLYDAGMYSEAVRLVGGATGAEADAWRTMCALRMHAGNAEAAARSFLARNAEYALASQVRYELALNLFDAGEYAKALEQFNQCKNLYSSQMAEYYYKMGHCAYSTGAWETAKSILSQVKGQP